MKRRARNYTWVSQTTLKSKRGQLVRKYGNKCEWCGKPDLKKGDLTLDHIIPLAEGGSSELDNLAIACKKCNARRATEQQKVKATVIRILTGIKI